MIYKELQREQEQFIETGDFTTDLQPAIEQLYRDDGEKVMMAQYRLLGGMDKKSDFSAPPGGCGWSTSLVHVWRRRSYGLTRQRGSPYRGL